jgi:hypothetical protein
MLVAAARAVRAEANTEIAMFRKLLILPIAAVFAFGLLTSSVEAGTGKKVAVGIAVGVAATALAIAAAQSANSHRGRDNYGYNHGIGASENAVAACIHRADRRVHRTRGGYARLDAVKKINKKGSKFKVTMLVTNIFGNRTRQRWVKCHVKHDRVVFFKYN